MSVGERQADALERQCELLELLVGSVGRLERREEPVSRRRTGFPKQLDHLAAGVTIPGMLEQFAKVVPESHCDAEGVDCTCGTRTPVLPARVTECLGACGRFFLRTRADVRCARYPVEWLVAA